MSTRIYCAACGRLLGLCHGLSGPAHDECLDGRPLEKCPGVLFAHALGALEKADDLGLPKGPRPGRCRKQDRPDEDVDGYGSYQDVARRVMDRPEEYQEPWPHG
jgi:hypothetical protein